MDDRSWLSEFRVLVPQVYQLLGRAGIDTTEPDQLLHGLAVLTAATIVRAAREHDYDLGDALQAAGAISAQLPRLVVQIGSYPQPKPADSAGSAVRLE